MQPINYLKDVPQSDCWIILRNQSTHHEGDERSKNFPGHGYAEHMTHAVVVDAICSTESEFFDELGSRIRLSHNDGTYRGFKIQSYRTRLVVEAAITKVPPADGKVIDGTSKTCDDCASAMWGQCDRHTPRD